MMKSVVGPYIGSACASTIRPPQSRAIASAQSAAAAAVEEKSVATRMVAGVSLIPPFYPRPPEGYHPPP